MVTKAEVRPAEAARRTAADYRDAIAAARRAAADYREAAEEDWEAAEEEYRKAMTASSQ